MPETRDKLAANALEPIGDSSDAFGARMCREIERWAKVVTAHV
jgi:hypothetical protein